MIYYRTQFGAPGSGRFIPFCVLRLAARVRSWYTQIARWYGTVWGEARQDFLWPQMCRCSFEVKVKAIVMLIYTSASYWLSAAQLQFACGRCFRTSEREGA